MSTIIEMLNARIAECETEIAACKRALAAMEPKADYKLHSISFGHDGSDGPTGKQTLSDIITEVLKMKGPASRNDIVTEVQAVRPETNAQTVSGTLNGMSKAGVVKLRNKKWALIKP